MLRPEQTFSGAVTYIAPKVDMDTRTVTVEASVADPKKLLRAGEFVSLQQIFSQQTALLVPEHAVIADEQGMAVFVYQDGKIHKQAIDIAQRKAGQVVVSKGLQKGQQVIVSPAKNLQSGQTVRLAKHQK